MGREPGPFDYVRNDVLCVVWVIELSPITRRLIRVFNRAGDRVAFLTVTALDTTQDDRKES